MRTTALPRIAGTLLVFAISASSQVFAQTEAEIADSMTAPRGEEESTSELTLDGVVRMSNEGLDDEVIVAAIEASTSVWNLTVEEILALKRRGVSDRVLAAIVRTGVILKHYGKPSRRDDETDRHSVSGNVVVERYVPTYVPPRAYPRSYVRFGLGWNVPWYGHYYTDPWGWGGWPTLYGGYGGYGHGGHYYGGHYYGGHHGPHGGHHSGSWDQHTNQHGGDKPPLGPRASSGGRGGRR